jgi:hypothetical protein
MQAWSVAAIAPGVAVTSGFEEESLFALQRAVHHQPVYLDSTRQPYAAAYFNWLFYAAYAAPLRPVVARYGDRAIPRATRILSALGAIAGVVVLCVFGRRLLAGFWPVTLPIATWVFFGPLVGWWAHTARPDVWALACETAATAVLLRYIDDRPTRAIGWAIALFYAAWAFKITYVFGLGAAIVFLIIRRRFAAAAWLAGGSVLLWAATYGLIDPGFRATMRSLAAVSDFYFSAGWSSVVDAGLKSLPLIALAGGLLLAGFRSDAKPVPSNSPANDAILLGGIGAVISIPALFWASCKIGAASNYFFTPVLMLAIVSLGLAARRPAVLPCTIFLSLVAITQIAVFAGKVGRIDLHPLADELAARWVAWKDQPEPRFSADTRLNLPWLNAHSPPLVLAFNYDRERSAGRTFESGGVGGLISSGYFAALQLRDDPLPGYDGGDLRRYRKTTTVAGLSVYLRRDLPPFPP